MPHENVKAHQFAQGLKEDALSLLLLEFIGNGVARQVYTCTLKPDEWVVKVEIADGYFQNVAEYSVWQSVSYNMPELRVWFAPVVAISDNGRFLVQARTHPCDETNLPARVPSFFTDMQPSNWGWLDGKVVCHDYGVLLTTEQGLNKRMKKATWH